MKKLLLVTTLIVASATRCDKLLDAINKHDLEIVIYLLDNKEYDANNYVQYMTAAREAVDVCRNDIMAEKIKPTMQPIWYVLTYMAALASMYPLYTFLKTQVQDDVFNIQYNALAWQSAQFLGANMLAGLFLGTGITLRCFQIENNYQEAIQVQQLLLGHSFR